MPRRRLILVAAAALVVLSMVVALVIGAREPWQPASAAWRAVDAQITARYADLPTVDTDELADWLDNPNADTSGAAPLLLDARSEAEYAVSHLPGAVRVDPAATGADPAVHAAPNRPLKRKKPRHLRAAAVDSTREDAGQSSFKPFLLLSRRLRSFASGGQPFWSV